MTFAKYFEAGKINLYNSLMYFLDYFYHALFIGLIIFIFINLWRVVYAGGGSTIEGFTIGMMIWYLVMTEAIVVSPGRIIEEISDEIQSGKIAQSINKPYNYILFQYCYSLSRTLVRFVITFLVSALVAFIFVGGIKVNYWGLPLVILSIFLALSLHFLIMAFIGVLAFWLEESRSLSFVYSKIVFVLGGMLVPLEIFPVWLAQISRLLPFSYIAYYPAKLWVSFDWNLALSVLMYQLIWIVVFIILVSLAYKICLKRISINGG